MLFFFLLQAIDILFAGNLVSPVDGSIEKDVYLHIQNEKIIAITNEKPTSYRKFINLSSAYVLPGLMDAHTHLCWHINHRKNDGYVLSQVREPTAYRAIQGVMNAKDMLLSGFTTVRDLGNAGLYADVSLRKSIEEELIIGPTIISSGPAISPFGGQRWVIPERPDYNVPEYLYADTRDEILKAIRKNIHFGATVIKIILGDQKYSYSVDDIRFIVEEAKKSGLKVAAHTSTDQTARDAILAGVASIEHGFGMSDSTIKRLAKSQIPFVSTTFSLPVLQSIQSDLSNPAEKDYRYGVELLKKCYEAGVFIAFGGDVIGKLKGYNRGEATLTFLKSFKDAGVSALHTLQALTINNAKTLGLEHSKGKLKTKYYADIIATKENPLDNIFALNDVHFVMKHGKIVKYENAEE